jgi:hypothetical protein
MSYNGRPMIVMDDRFRTPRPTAGFSVFSRAMSASIPAIR